MDINFIDKNIESVGDEFDVVNNDASGSTIPTSNESFNDDEENDTF